MKNTFGNNITITLFGESHGPQIGAVVDGLTPGMDIDLDFIRKQLELRKPHGRISTARVEADEPKIVSGVFEGKTTGTPLCILFENGNTKSKDYAKTKDLMRPGHADFTATQKYHGFADYRGGGHFSGRLTAPMCIAGGICKQILEQKGIKISAFISSIGKEKLTNYNQINQESFDGSMINKDFPVLTVEDQSKAKAEIEKARKDLDSVGGTIDCVILGVPVGTGEYMFDSIESVISQLAFAVPAVKGIEFGTGFGFATMRGSKANDEFYYDGETIKTRSNNNGGINGGISNGMPITFRVVVKPTPSIAKQQNTVDLTKKENVKIKIEGRHDACIVPRAVPVIEAISAIAIFDCL
jgi:chorismate synthase